MRIVLADTLAQSLEALDKSVRGLVKRKVFDFQLAPATSGKSYHRIDKAPQQGFWSFRVNRDLRLVVFQEGDLRVLCHVAHHDDAYEWAMRHRYEEHPNTTEIQLVRIEKSVREVIERRVKVIEELPPLFTKHTDDYLLALGVPPVWLDAIKLVTEDTLLEALDELPSAVAERLMRLYEGKPVPRPVIAAGATGWDHPDTARHFRVLGSERELQQALEFPWQKWIVFLHPEQRKVAERTFSGSALVTGGAGTGKTVVALHRAQHLAEANPNARILLTTFSRTLSASLERNARVLMGEDSPLLDRIHVANVHRYAVEAYEEAHGAGPHLINDQSLQSRLASISGRLGFDEFPLDFIEAEWWNVIDAWGIHDWSSYLTFARVGRKQRLGARQRQRMWRVFEAMLGELRADNRQTYSALCDTLRRDVEHGLVPRFDHVVVDEAQDFGPAELRLLRALVLEGPDDLFLSGDAGQRIFQSRFPWLAADIDVRGRSSTLRVNYRTTEQIRRFADRMRFVVHDEADPLSLDEGAVSLLGGPEPTLIGADDKAGEILTLSTWLEELLQDGYQPEDVAIFARTKKVRDERGRPAIERSGARVHELNDDREPEAGCVSLGTMHRAKGLEFKAVAVAGCDRRMLPQAWLAERIGDAAEREAFIERERHVFYVACTRARERLLVTWVGEGSEFLEAVERD